MTGTTCPSCGHTLTVTRTGADGVSRCPRCGDPLPELADGTLTLAHQPQSDVPSTVLPDSAGATIDAPATTPQIRMPSIPGYELLGIIGRGGMGVVYKARQLSPRRIVAVKLLLAGRADRFRAEVAAVARLQHPNVVRIHEVGDLDGRPYFSMEYVSGGSLAALLRTGPLQPQQAAELVAQIARAVQHAHDRGIIHRDLKPANILLAGDGIRDSGFGDDEQPTRSSTPKPNSRNPIPDAKIADFGLAKHLEGSSSGAGPLTQSGAILGTPSYMAPEQAKGKVRDIGPAVDVYALGAILYECLLGRPPFREDSQLETIVKVMSEEPESPRKLRPGVPRDLETICLKCLRKEPAKRYASARELVEDLERFLDDRPITARSRTARERLGSWVRRRREYVLLAGGAAVAAMLVLAALSWWPKPAPPTVKLEPPPPPPASLPLDLQLVPPDAFAFATIRVADVWANPAARELASSIKPLNEQSLSLEALGRLVEEATSIRPENIERATFVLPDTKGTTEPLILLHTRQPYSLERLDAMLQRQNRFQMQEVNGHRIYISFAGTRDLCFLAYSDRILVMGESARLERIASAPQSAAGPQMPALQRAAGTHTVVVGLYPPADLVNELIKFLKLDAQAGTVTRMQTLTVVADLTHPTGPSRRVGIALGGRADYPTPEAAAAAQPHLPRVVQTLCRMIAREQSVLDAELVNTWLEPVASAAWDREENTLVARASVGIDLPDLTAALQVSEARAASENNLRVIAIAMQRYHDKHGRFPPAVVTNAEGKPLYSWRVLILPELGRDDVYRRFHLNRAWDHPSNQPLLDKMPSVFAAPGTPGGIHTTHYQVLGGTGGMFDSPRGRTRNEVSDGTMNTLLIVEAPTAVPWSQPDDLSVDGTEFPALGGVFSTGFHAAMVDGSTRFFPHKRTTPEMLRSWFTRAGGEVVSFP